MAGNDDRIKRIAAGYVPAAHDICSCAACGASNLDDKADLFYIRADRQCVRLCRDCLEYLCSIGSKILRDTDSPNDWTRRLYRDLFPGSVPDEAAMARLGDLLDAIPSSVGYACLAASYGAGYIRREWEPATDISRMLAGDRRIIAEDALDKLRTPGRLGYIEDGVTDLSRSFTPHAIRLLARARIHTADDLADREEAYILRIPGMTLDLAAVCAAVRKAAKYEQQKREEAEEYADH